MEYINDILLKYSGKEIFVVLDTDKNILKGAYERQDFYIKKTYKTRKYKNYKI
jgi:hypothetical protein